MDLEEPLLAVGCAYRQGPAQERVDLGNFHEDGRALLAELEQRLGWNAGLGRYGVGGALVLGNGVLDSREHDPRAPKS